MTYLGTVGGFFCGVLASKAIRLIGFVSLLLACVLNDWLWDHTLVALGLGIWFMVNPANWASWVVWGIQLYVHLSFKSVRHLLVSLVILGTFMFLLHYFFSGLLDFLPTFTDDRPEKPPGKVKVRLPPPEASAPKKERMQSAGFSEGEEDEGVSGFDRARRLAEEKRRLKNERGMATVIDSGSETSPLIQRGGDVPLSGPNRRVDDDHAARASVHDRRNHPTTAVSNSVLTAKKEELLIPGLLDRMAPLTDKRGRILRIAHCLPKFLLDMCVINVKLVEQWASLSTSIKHTIASSTIQREVGQDEFIPYPEGMMQAISCLNRQSVMLQFTNIRSWGPSYIVTHGCDKTSFLKALARKIGQKEDYFTRGFEHSHDAAIRFVRDTIGHFEVFIRDVKDFCGGAAEYYIQDQEFDRLTTVNPFDYRDLPTLESVWIGHLASFVGTSGTVVPGRRRTTPQEMGDILRVKFAEFETRGSTVTAQSYLDGVETFFCDFFAKGEVDGGREGRNRHVDWRRDGAREVRRDHDIGTKPLCEYCAALSKDKRFLHKRYGVKHYSRQCIHAPANKGLTPGNLPGEV
jgi:hypothetical protein